MALKACRRAMTEKNWSRTWTNARVDRVRRVFRWGVEEELVPATVYEALRAVKNLRRGKSSVRETEKVKPVDLAFVEAALPFMPFTVEAMVRLQLLAGCRLAEVCIIRRQDIDQSNPACWIFRPHAHKTEHHEHERLILIGPRAQQVLQPFHDRQSLVSCFSPAEAEADRNARKRKSRKSPMTFSQRARKPKANRSRAYNDNDTHSYRRAIARACLNAEKATVLSALFGLLFFPSLAWVSCR